MSARTLRMCGSCTECCRVITIDTPELTKPADVACVNCGINSGCTIYATRPPVCRTFECGWLASPSAFDDDQRPDISGIIISNPQLPIPSRMLAESLQVLVAHECWPDASAPGTVGYALIQSLALTGAVVFGANRGTHGALVTAPTPEMARRALEEAVRISHELSIDAAYDRTSGTSGTSGAPA